MSEELLPMIINTIYKNRGFQGVIEAVEDKLEYGTVKKKNGLCRITTGGWSDDEHLVHTLCDMRCKFNRHYCGYIRGGAFYFCEQPWARVEMFKVTDGDEL